MADNLSEPFLYFDPFETPNFPSASVDNDIRDRHIIERNQQAHHGQSSSTTTADRENTEMRSMTPILSLDSFAHAKGKGVSNPMSIRPHDLHLDGFDTFDSSAYSYAGSTSNVSSPTFYDIQPLISSNNISSHTSSSAGAGHQSHATFPFDNGIPPDLDTGKGKERAPTLPPLFFMPAFGYNSLDWQPSTSSSSTPGFTSYGFTSSTSPSHHDEDGAMHIRHPSAFSEHSVSAPSSFTAQLELPSEMRRDRSSSPTVRRLTLDQHNISSPHSHVYTVPCTPAAIDDIHHYDDADFRAAQHTTPALIDALVIPPFASQAINDTIGRPVGPRHKGRSHSDPLLTASTALNDVFRTIPLKHRYSFQESLPREIKIWVFASLVQLHEDEHRCLVSQSRWSARIAFTSRNRWVGRERGMRELIKFSRVCKSWQDLVFDGQLWVNMDLCAFPQLPTVLLKRLSDKSGAFVKRLDLTGHTSLDSSTLIDVINNLSSMPMLYPLRTNITSVVLRGCVGVNSDALDFLLRLTPSLQHLNLKGSNAASNYICKIMGEHCPHLVSLDLSQCAKVDGNGLARLMSSFIGRSEPSALKSLKIAGMRYVTDNTLSSIGRAFPNLEILDLSYVRSLHNSSLDAFVALDDDDKDIPSVLLNARQLGRDDGQYRRRITQLRHLNLSFCLLLSDIGVSNLAHSIPRLEFLELAGIGPDMGDDGLIRLLETTPLIRRLDLEDAGISNRVLAAITPPEPAETTPITALRGNGRSSSNKDAPLHAGRALEYLTISSVTSDITDDAISALIQNCPRLRMLEADGTPMSGSVLREFVRTMRRRKVRNARVVAVDCRMVGESVVQDMLNMEIARPRLGWRAYGARALAYVDGRDKEERECFALRGHDECDEARVVVKSFYAWQTLDRVQLAREKAERRSGRARRFEGDDEAQDGTSMAGRIRWWSSGGRGVRRSGTAPTPPNIFDTNNDRDGCNIM